MRKIVTWQEGYTMRIILFITLLFSTPVFSQQKPNVIYIMSDDHDDDAISAYNKQFISTPNIDRIAKEGMRFNKAFVGNSICSPSRATLLTGQHSHKNGVKDNRTPFDQSRMTMPKLLQAAGYETAVIGKWHLHSLPTGFDYWKILPGMGQYWNTRIIEMSGDTITEKGYSSDVLTDNAINWLSNRKKDKPFVLLFHHKAPHRYFFPNLKHLEVFHKKKFLMPSTLFNDTTGKGSAWRMQTMSILPDMKLCSDLKVDPNALMDIPELRPDSAEIAYYNAIMRRVPEEKRARYLEIYAERGKLIREKKLRGKKLLEYKYQWYMQDYLACIASIDESIGRILDYLDTNDMAKNTAVVYTSDQGFYLGENGWFDKRFMYDVSMQTPLLVRWPEVIKARQVNNDLVQNIDFAPTILDMTGTPVPDSMQGVSLVPLFRGQQLPVKRDFLYYHYYEYVKDHTVIPHRGIRGKRYKLIHFYTVDEWELYDLQKDPEEQRNLVRSKEYAGILKEMKEQLEKERKKYDDL